MLFLCWILLFSLVCSEIKSLLPKPKVLLLNARPLTEFSKPSFECKIEISQSQANATSTPLVYTWLLNGVVKTENDDGVYTPRLSRNNNGDRLKCFAKDTNGVRSQDSDEFRLDIQYKPVRMNFRPAKVLYVLYKPPYTVGPVVCSSDCNPPCAFQWLINTVIHNGQTLPERSFPPSENQTSLTCVARNVHGTLARHIRVISVPETPWIISCKPASEGSYLIDVSYSNTNINFEMSDDLKTSSFVPLDTSSWKQYPGGMIQFTTTNVSKKHNTFIVRVYADNREGRRKYSYTLCESDTQTSETTIVSHSVPLAPGIGIGVLLVLVILIILLITAVILLKTTDCGKEKAKHLKAVFFGPPNQSNVKEQRNERNEPEGRVEQQGVSPNTNYEALGQTQPKSPSTYEKLSLYENQSYKKTENVIYVNDMQSDEML